MNTFTKGIIATMLFAFSAMTFANTNTPQQTQPNQANYYAPTPYYSGGNNNWMPWNMNNNGNNSMPWNMNNNGNNSMPWNMNNNGNNWMPWNTGNNGWGNGNWPIWTPMYWADEMNDSWGGNNWGGNNFYGNKNLENNQ